MVLSCSVLGLWLPVVAEIGRFSALTMPLVTVFCRPSGDPTATTPSPTRRLADEPSVTGVRPETPRALTTAVSLAGSGPTMRNGAVRPSLNVTRAFASPPAGAPPAAGRTPVPLVRLRAAG